MRLRNAGALLAIGIIGGCAQERSRSVYVDLDSILAAEKPEVATARVIGSAPKGEAPKTVSINGTSGFVYQDRSAGNSARAKALIERNRQRAIEVLRRQLTSLYLTNVDASRAKLMRSVDASKTEVYTAAFDQLRSIFEPYAEEKGWRLAELTSLVGFPDPDPTSKREPRVKGPIYMERFARAKELRQELRDLDARYNAQAAQLLANAKQNANQALTDALIEVQKMQQDAINRAEREAKDQVAQTSREMSIELTNRPDIRVEPAPPRQSTIPAVPAPPEAPRVQPHTLSLKERRSILEGQLRIWLVTNRLTLSKSKTAPDRTEDFREWRQARVAGT